MAVITACRMADWPFVVSEATQSSYSAMALFGFCRFLRNHGEK